MSTNCLKYALLGWPVEHSVSPQMQEAGFREIGINARYELIEVPPEEIPTCLERLVAEGYQGWNVTVPHKEQVAALLNDIHPDATAAGSVNTVLNQKGHLSGFSTDGYGLATAVEECFGIAVPKHRFLFLGSGGAARATSVYFARQGAAELVLVNRTVSKAEALADTIRRAAPECQVKVLPLAEDILIGKALERVDVLVQATALGLRAGDPLPLNPGLIPSHVAVMDMIYGCTPFRQGAEKGGCRTADGRGMLLHQGVRSFEIWTKQRAPVETMRNALEKALQQD